MSYRQENVEHEWIDVSHHGSPDWVCKRCWTEKVYANERTGEKGNVHETCILKLEGMEILEHG